MYLEKGEKTFWEWVSIESGENNDWAEVVESVEGEATPFPYW